jgi:methylated-DNA-protein-cysteine methyltransferase-like protein
MPVLPPAHERLYTRIYTIVRQIPRGKVATYGQVAGIVGDCTARMVGYAMAAAPDDVPWQRVINAQGKISPRADGWGSEAQRLRLEEEGVHLDADHKLDLKHYRWGGPELDWLLTHDFAPADPGDHPEGSAPGDNDVQPPLF